jgi:calcium/calmodulin-dependent protein kinase I
LQLTKDLPTRELRIAFTRASSKLIALGTHLLALESIVTMDALDNDKLIKDGVPGCTLHQLTLMLASTSVRDAALASGDSSGVATKSQPFADLYNQEKRLRSGSYGTVYTCRCKRKPEITYAVKIIERSKLKNKDVDSIFREVKILLELTQSSSDDAPLHVVQLIDFFIEPSQMYMVQVFAAGGDVYDRLGSRQLYTEKDARGLAQNLIQTIHFLHTHKPYPIVHRDLKPENLLLLDDVNDTQILVADFGFARHLKGDERCRTRCGTPAYVSPEIVLGLPYGCSVDLWSIGCLLYMLVAGYPPFVADNHRALFRKIRAGDFEFRDESWQNVSIEAKQVIAHLLTVNVSKRWTAEQALQCDWFRKTSASELAKTDLSDSLKEMKRTNPKAAWKRAVNVLGFCATAAFWKPDAISFTQQMGVWDKEMSTAGSDASAASVPGALALLSKLPKVKFADRYDMQHQLKKGRNATVWKCVHKATGTVYAVKVIVRAGLEPKDDEAVLNEVAVMQSLSGNKYVVQLLDFYEEPDCFYLVMEFCAGGDVFDRMVQLTTYTENDARAFSLTLLKSIASIHKIGLVHRDIKPQNLLLLSSSDNAAIRLADFGFAQRVHTPESLTSRFGTPAYVAPEILKNVPHDQRVDLWSAGVVIFILLVGYPPFFDNNDDPQILFHKIRNGEWAFHEKHWKHISNEAKDLIKGLLVADPNERWTIEEALRSPWIQQDPTQLSEVDLSESLRVLQEKKTRLRSLASAFMGMGDNIKPVEVATLAQAEASGPAQS